MYLFLTILHLSLLGIVFVQDIKYRAVSWLLFPALLVLYAVMNSMQLNLTDFLFNAGINMLLLSGIFLFVTIYFSIKNGKIINITHQLIGWGDLLFFICLSVLFSPLNFILFFTISLLLITLIGGIYIVLTANNQVQIPLAGLQAILLIALLLFNYMIPFKLNTDEWLLMLI